MSEGRPHLRAVPGEKAGEAPRAAAGRGTSGRGRLLLAGLAVLAFVCAVGWAVQARQAAEARAELETARGTIAELQGELEAREALLAGARERSGALVDEAEGLAERVRELSAWLAGEAPDAGATAPDAPEAAPGAEGAPSAPPGSAPF